MGLGLQVGVTYETLAEIRGGEDLKVGGPGHSLARFACSQPLPPFAFHLAPCQVQVVLLPPPAPLSLFDQTSGLVSYKDSARIYPVRREKLI